MSPVYSNFFSSVFLHSVGNLLYDSNLFLHFLSIPNIVDPNSLTLLNVIQSVHFSYGSSDQSVFDRWLGLSSQRMFSERREQMNTGRFQTVWIGLGLFSLNFAARKEPDDNHKSRMKLQTLTLLLYDV